MNKSLTLEHAKSSSTTQSIAALPMYDMQRLQPANDAFWRAIAERLREAGLTDVPASLTRSDDYRRDWQDPHLLLGQACGYPLLTRFRSAVQIVATPIYRSPGCDGLEHRSFFIVNAKTKHRALRDLRGSICALNSFDSNTGMNLLRASIAPIAEGRPFFSSIVVTGSHLKSLEAVAAGYAGIAAIDCVSFAHFRRFAPELTKRVWIIGESVGTPAPPFITSRHTNAKTLSILKDALNDVATAPQLECTRSALDLNGFAFESENAYERLLRLEEDAASCGFPELR